jgi:hypothetical protein
MVNGLMGATMAQQQPRSPVLGMAPMLRPAYAHAGVPSMASQSVEVMQAAQQRQLLQQQQHHQQQQQQQQLAFAAAHAQLQHAQMAAAAAARLHAGSPNPQAGQVAMGHGSNGALRTPSGMPRVQSMPDLKNLTAPAADDMAALVAAMSPVLGAMGPSIQIGDMNDPFGLKGAELRDLEVRICMQFGRRNGCGG